MTDDEAIAEAEEAAAPEDKRGPLRVNVNVEIDIAAIICAFVLPPVIGAALAFAWGAL